MPKGHSHRAALTFSDSSIRAGQFRLLNQYFYTHSSTQAQRYFRLHPEQLEAYHEGYREQAQGWPCNPVEAVADLLRPLCKGKKLADLGCGDGFLQIELNKGESRPLKTYSIDLMKRRDFVIKANLSRLPIKAGRIDIAVFCLSLMGTDYLKFICEANRVLRQGGSLIVAEVASRFASLRVFHLMMGHLGFKKVKAQRLGSTDFFVLLQYQKQGEPNFGSQVWPELLEIAQKEGLATVPQSSLKEFSQQLLRPCLYKPR